jgi:hypothetical protein
LPAVLEQWLALRSRARQHHGRDPFVGRHHRALLLEAGFARPRQKPRRRSVPGHRRHD